LSLASWSRSASSDKKLQPVLPHRPWYVDNLVLFCFDTSSSTTKNIIRTHNNVVVADKYYFLVFWVMIYSQGEIHLHTDRDALK